MYIGVNLTQGVPMAAYVIADVNVNNPELFKKYFEQVPATIEQYGGKYLVRGGKVEKSEGDWEPSRFVIIEFQDMATLKKWYSSQEYSGPLQIRKESADTNVLFVEGI